MKKLLFAGIAALSVFAISSCHKAGNKDSKDSASALDAATVANEKVEKVAATTDVGTVKGTGIYFVGDSTVCNYIKSDGTFTDATHYQPRYGYGSKFQEYLDGEKATVVNLAMSGRSSKSFLTEQNYETLKNNIKKGDYLIIGFGHNDEKAESGRYTNPNGAKEEAGSFKNSLYENYVKLAQDKGAIPVLCTPIIRRAPGKEYKGSVVHVTKDVENFPGGDYPKAIRELGQETGTLVVDLTEITKTRYETLADDKETAKFHAHPSHKAASTDNTHLNAYGAATVAFDVVSALKANDANFAKLLKENISAPDVNLVVVNNPDYKMPKYEQFTPDAASSLWTTTAPWYGTVFGDCGGEEKLQDPVNYGIEEKDGKVTMYSGSTDGEKSVGKIAGNSDGILFYFQKIEVSKDFTLKAKAKVLNLNANNNQVSFGLMVRDDVYIDKYDNTINTDYVAAGPLKMANNDDYTSSWTRKDGKLNETHNAGQPKPAKDDVIDIEITKKGNVYTTKFGKDVATYEMNLKSVDAKVVYAGLFTVRSAYIEFSDVSLVEN